MDKATECNFLRRLVQDNKLTAQALGVSAEEFASLRADANMIMANANMSDRYDARDIIRMMEVHKCTSGEAAAILNE